MPARLRRLSVITSALLHIPPFFFPRRRQMSPSVPLISGMLSRFCSPPPTPARALEQLGALYS